MDNRSITRRNVLAGIPLAAIAASFPALADSPRDDATLVELGKALEASMRAEVSAYSQVNLDAGEWSPDCEAAYEASYALVGRIEPLPVHTVAGLRAKANAANWCSRGVPYGDGKWSCDPDGFGTETTDMRLVTQIVEALLLNAGGLVA